ncbi:hypothetical protein C8R44DRAFT_894307 [Mycena epipterygia]|nr:hypothetical protein C8R44DRAFT_894307 [Mycena epipterygia]
MRDFPQELIDHVIDKWKIEDFTGMKPCSLACKRWLHRTRFHLFFRVYLDAENLCGFINLVDMSTLPILAFIQHLKLCFASFDKADLARIHACPHLTDIQICSEKVVGRDRAAVDWFDSHEFLQTHLRSCSVNSFEHLGLQFPRRDLPLRTVIDPISCVPTVKSLSSTADLGS